MPFWSFEQEKLLKDMIKENRPIEEIAGHFHRSLEATKLKIRRLGLAVPESNKATYVTTTPKLEPVKAQELPSILEALQRLWGATLRLKGTDVTPAEVRKLRLLLTAVKSYVHLEADYLVRMKNVEKGLLQMMEDQLEHFKALEERAQSPEEKSQWQKRIRDLEKSIGTMRKGIEGEREPEGFAINE